MKLTFNGFVYESSYNATTDSLTIRRFNYDTKGNLLNDEYQGYPDLPSKNAGGTITFNYSTSNNKPSSMIIRPYANWKSKRQALVQIIKLFYKISVKQQNTNFVKSSDLIVMLPE